MRTDTAKPVRLADYRVPDYLIDRVDLDVRLDGSATLVVSRLAIRPNPAGVAGAPLALDGDGLVARRVEIDGVALPRLAGSRQARRPRHRRAAAPRLHPDRRNRARPGGQYAAHGALSLRLGLLHAMRGRRISPHHLFSRPARRAVGLYDAHRGRTRGSSGAARQRQQDRRPATWPGRRGISRSGTTPIPSPAISSPSSAATSARSGTNSSRRRAARSISRSMSSMARKSAPPMRSMR